MKKVRKGCVILVGQHQKQKKSIEAFGVPAGRIKQFLHILFYLISDKIQIGRDGAHTILIKLI